MKKVNFLMAVLFTAISVTGALAQNNCLNFDGVDDYVDLGNQIGNGNIRTIEMWFKPDENIDGNSNHSYNALIARNNANEDCEFNISFSTIGHLGQLAFGLAVTHNDYHYIYSDQSSWTAGTWYHVAVVVDNTFGMKMYINGITQASTETYNVAPCVTNDITALGKWGNMNIRYFKGSIDDVRIWNYVRTQSEIQNNFNNELTGTESGLIAYYNFNQGISGGNNPTVTSLQDLTNNYNGNLQNFTLNGLNSNWICHNYTGIQPNVACYQTANFDATSCTWNITGTQPTMPILACYQTATWDNTACQWNVTGTQPAQPTLASYQTATFNTTTCVWDIINVTPSCEKWTLCGNPTTASDFLGTLNAQPLNIKTNNTQRAIITSTGEMGIGTSTPLHKLQVHDGALMLSGAVAGFGGPQLLFSDNTSTYPNGRWAIEYITADSTRPSMGGLNFWNPYNPGGGPAKNYSLFLKDDGKIGMNVTDDTVDTNFCASALPNGYKLYVNGGILTTKVKVANYCSSAWADYVFANDYKLKPLTEVETFIKENKHLPNVPSAIELEKEGLDLGKMQATQMEKIEELTLYLIELKKEVDNLKTENATLKNMVQSKK